MAIIPLQIKVYPFWARVFSTLGMRFQVCTADSVVVACHCSPLPKPNALRQELKRHVQLNSAWDLKDFTWLCGSVVAVLWFFAAHQRVVVLHACWVES